MCTIFCCALFYYAYMTNSSILTWQTDVYSSDDLVLIFGVGLRCFCFVKFWLCYPFFVDFNDLFTLIPQGYFMDTGMLVWLPKCHWSNLNGNEWNLPIPNPTFQWRHNGHDSVSNHQPPDCLLNRLFRRRLKKTLKLRVSGLCTGNSPVTGEFPAQRASNAENISI